MNKFADILNSSWENTWSMGIVNWEFPKVAPDVATNNNNSNLDDGLAPNEQQDITLNNDDVFFDVILRCSDAICQVYILFSELLFDSDRGILISSYGQQKRHIYNYVDQHEIRSYNFRSHINQGRTWYIPLYGRFIFHVSRYLKNKQI